jgi:glycosyltransferase involved in cell wall biosynthesis
MMRAAVAKRLSAVICVSEDSRSRFLRYAPDFPRERVVAIAPGLEPPAEVDPPVEDARTPYFLTVGAIEPRRNHLTLLDAFRRARGRGLNLRWIVVGREHCRVGPILERLRATPGIGVRGFVDAGELERLYRAARFVAIASHHEGFGLVPLEAMLRGTPTAVATGGALDQTAGDAALRVAPDDVEGWATALLRLDREDTFRWELIHRGYAQSARFSWRDAAEAHVRVFRRVVGTRG